MSWHWTRERLGLWAPYWGSTARGTIGGLTREVTARHIARAIEESIYYQTRDVAETMALDSKEPLRRLRVDGDAGRLEHRQNYSLKGGTMQRTPLLRINRLQNNRFLGSVWGEMIAEFLGTMVLILFGDGSVALALGAGNGVFTPNPLFNNYRTFA